MDTPNTRRAHNTKTYHKPFGGGARERGGATRKFIKNTFRVIKKYCFSRFPRGSVTLLHFFSVFSSYILLYRSVAPFRCFCALSPGRTTLFLPPKPSFLNVRCAKATVGGGGSPF